MAELTKSLYVSTGSIQLLQWTDSEQRVFESLKKAFISAPALTSPSPDISKFFNLYVSENQSITKISQILGPWKRPMSYLSKRLDIVSKS